MEKLEQKIQNIEERNKKVEIDKDWETSWTRRGLLTLFTYVAIGAYLQAIGIQMPWLNAVVPAAAFMLSTLTMPFFKNQWIINRRKKFSIAEKKNLIEEKEKIRLEHLEKLKHFIIKKERVANDQVQRFLGVSNATAERYLDALEKEELLKQVGRTGKHTYYRVLRPPVK